MNKSFVEALNEVYKPKSPDEQKFVDKHVTIKHPDRNGNGDDVFNGNTKKINRKKERHGYDSGEDEKVYEEVEELDEDGMMSKVLAAKQKWASYPTKSNEMSYKAAKEAHRKMKASFVKEELKGDQKKIDANKNGKLDSHDFKLLRNKKKVEEDIDLDEAVKVDKKNYSWGKMVTVHQGSSTSYPLHPEHQEKIRKLSDGDKTSFKDETGATVHAHRVGDTVHLKKPASSNSVTSVSHSHFTEEVDQIDELSKETLLSYVAKAKLDAIKHGDRYNKGIKGHFDDTTISKTTKKAGRKMVNRENGFYDAYKKIAKEDVQIDELSRSTITRYSIRAADAEKDGGKPRPKGRAMAASKNWGGAFNGVDKAKIPSTNEEHEEDGIIISEGTMRLDKVNIVHHDDTPEAKEFAKHYTKGKIRDFRSAPTGKQDAADEKHAEHFYGRYTHKSIRNGFAGSGTSTYHDTKTGTTWQVDRRPNGKTFYGTDHRISKHKADVKEDVQIDELSNSLKDRYAEKARTQRFKAMSQNRDDEHYASQFAPQMDSNDHRRFTMLQKNIKNNKNIIRKRTAGLKLAKEDVQIDELSKDVLKSYLKKTAEGKYNIKETDPVKRREKLLAKGRQRHGYIGKAIDRAYPGGYQFEEDVQIDELSKKTLGNYISSASADKSHAAHDMGRINQIASDSGTTEADRAERDKLNKRHGKRSGGIGMAVNKLTKEDFDDEILEQIQLGIESYFESLGEDLTSEEISEITLDVAEQLMSQADQIKALNKKTRSQQKSNKMKISKLKPLASLTKEEVISNVINTYVDIKEETLEEQLVSKLDEILSRREIESVLELFSNLTEENQYTLLETVSTEDGVNEVLDFIIKNRVEN